MIAKGNLHDGNGLAAYLVKGKTGERGELFYMEGFGASDLRDAMRDVVIASGATQAQSPFFHVYTRFAPGEMLDNEANRNRCLDIARREIKTLGMDGQPYAVSFHIDRESGDMHMHIAVSRIARNADGQLFAIDPGLYKNKLKYLSRECERDFALREVSNHRQAGDLARAAERNEFEESRRLGTDLKVIRAGIVDCFEKSDSGKALKTALEDRGLILANGDRRDCFVVIDQEGGQHALNKKLTGLTLAQTRARLGDLDRAQLPSVEQAQEMRAERQAAREAQGREKHGRGVEDGQGSAATRSEGQQRGPQPEIKPLGKTAGEIRLAWQLTRGAEPFARAIEDRGLILVYVTAEEARASERARAFAKTIGRQNRGLKEGFAVVDQRGTVTRIDQRTTGDLREEIDKRLGGIDRDQLLSVTEAKEAMREANRAAWAEQRQAEREEARPMSAIETRVADALKTTMTGYEFAEVIDKAGLTVTRATAGDVQALDALRRQDELAGMAGFEASGRHYARLEIGDLAAVTRAGDVFRLSPRKLDAAEIEQRLADTQPRLPSVTEARAHNQINREETAELWARHRAENTARRVIFSEARDADREIRSTAATVTRETEKIIGMAEETVDRTARAAGRLLGSAAKLAEGLFSLFGGFFATPKRMTKDEAARADRAADEKAEVRSDQAARQEKAAATDWQQFEERRNQAQAEQGFAERFGIPRPSRDRERDDDYGRERER